MLAGHDNSMLENMLYQTTHSTLITVEPNLVVDILLCPKFIVFDLYNYISVQGKMVGPDFCYVIRGFTGLYRVIIWMSNIGGRGALLLVKRPFSCCASIINAL